MSVHLPYAQGSPPVSTDGRGQEPAPPSLGAEQRLGLESRGDSPLRSLPGMNSQLGTACHVPVSILPFS